MHAGTNAALRALLAGSLLVVAGCGQQDKHYGTDVSPETIDSKVGESVTFKARTAVMSNSPGNALIGYCGDPAMSGENASFCPLFSAQMTWTLVDLRTGQETWFPGAIQNFGAFDAELIIAAPAPGAYRVFANCVGAGVEGFATWYVSQAPIAKDGGTGGPDDKKPDASEPDLDAGFIKPDASSPDAGAPAIDSGIIKPDASSPLDGSLAADAGTAMDASSGADATTSLDASASDAAALDASTVVVGSDAQLPFDAAMTPDSGSLLDAAVQPDAASISEDAASTSPDASSVALDAAVIPADAAMSLDAATSSPVDAGDSTPPQLTGIDPAHNTAGVQPTIASIRARFSEAMDPASFGPYSFTLTGPDGMVPGMINVSVDEAIFTPSTRLRVATSYTVQIDGSVRDLAGNLLGAAFTSSFVTSDGAWSAAQTLAASTAPKIQLAMADDGVAVAVWETTAGVLSAGVHTPGSGWSLPMQVGQYARGYGEYQLTGSPSGDALLVWRSQNQISGVYQISARRYTRAGGWGTETILGGSTLIGDWAPTAAMFATGEAIAAFLRDTNSDTMPWLANMTAAGVWNAGSVLYANATAQTSIRAAASEDGSGVLVFKDGGLKASRYLNESASAASTIQATLPYLNGLQVAMDGSGNAVTIWGQRATSGTVNCDAYASVYTAGIGWSAPHLLETGTAYSLFAPSVVMSSVGDAMAVWNGNGTARISRLEPNGTWTAPETALSASYPIAAMDGSGNAFVAASVFPMPPKITVVRYVRRTGTWDIPATIATTTTSDGRPGAIAVDKAGRALLVWQDYQALKYAWFE